MSSLKDVECLSLNNIIKMEEPKSAGLINEIRTTTDPKIETQTIENGTDQGNTYLYRNKQMIRVGYFNSQPSHHYPVRSKINGNDHFNIIWATCNILCCGVFLGLFALIISIGALKMKRQRNYQSARCATIWATLINIFATIAGVIIIIIISLHYLQKKIY